ncbi:MAG: hypothetical protein NTU74_01805 [Deltaproteobacteria bacterium]|nr:hypothetical protein [Deltaproteobacteria bacterium]
MEMKSWRFRERCDLLIMLAESKRLLSAFDTEYAALLDDVRQDGTERKTGFLKTLAEIKARQLAFKLRLQSTRREAEID